MNAEPTVPDKPELGAAKIISGLITSVGCDVAELLPTVLVAVVVTTMYLPSSETVGVKVAEVAPDILVQLVGSLGSSQTFHW
jgi:hypothetical protein